MKKSFNIDTEVIIMRLTNIPTIQEDEYLYSYICRCADANGFDIKRFCSIVLGKEWSYNSARVYDVDMDVVKVSELLGLPSALPFYLKTSLFNGVTPFQNRYDVAKRIDILNNGYLSATDKKEANTTIIKRLRICPECMQKEILEKHMFYYHRAHQMPNVSVCHKHGCDLKEVDCMAGDEFKYPLNLIGINNKVSDELNYAKFCVALLNAEDFDVSEISVRKTIYQKTGEYNKNWNYQDLMLKCFEIFKDFETFEMNCQLSAPYCFVLDQRIQKSKDYKVLNSKIRGNRKYYDHRIIELVHKDCNTRFITTPYRMLEGYGCPFCDSKKDVDELLRAVNENIINSNLLSEFEDFRNENNKKSGTFELLSIDGDYLHLRHSECGKEFKSIRNAFFHYPWCKKCNLKVRTAESFKNDVFNLVGNKYTVIKDFVSEKEVVTLVHNTCGRELTCYPRHFMSGQRCHVCFQKPVVEMFIDRLKLDYKNDDIIFLEDIDYSSQFADKSKVYIAKAEKKSLIRKLAPGVYTFSDRKISEKEIYENKYLVRNGERVGYYKGMSFAYDIGLTPTRPDITSICYNNESTVHGRTKVYFGVKTKIHSTPVTVNNENWLIIATMDFLKSAKSNGFNYDQLGLLKDLLIRKNIKIDDFNDYYKYFKPWIRNKVITLYEEN